MRKSLVALAPVLLGISAIGLALVAGCRDSQPVEEAAPAVARPNLKIAAAIRRVLHHAPAENSAPQPASESAGEPPADQHAGDQAEEPRQVDQVAQAPPTAAEEAPTNAETTSEDSEPQATQIVEEPVPPAAEAAVADEVAPRAEPEASAEPLATLLPPQKVEQAPGEYATDQPSPPAPVAEVQQGPIVTLPDPKTPELDGLSDQERRLVEQVIRECSPAVTGVLTDARVNEMATTSIRAANALANRGAQFAARQKLIEVLRMISQAKDAHEGARLHTSALAAGLRALEEAEDFAPRGTQLEAELKISLITAAHRTPIARRLGSSNILPRQMMDLYFRYAQLKLAMSVAGEPSGSMALYALGKVTSQMGHSEPDHNRLAARRAMAFQQAALLAHNQNYFAAHELGVLLAESGHLVEAENLLQQVAARRPNPTVYRNLAFVQQRLGRTRQAANSRAMASRLAGQAAPGSGQIRWVGPDAFGRSQVRPAQYAGPMPSAPRPRSSSPRTAMAPRPRAQQPYSPVSPGSWR